jgi:hypothetical protein
MLSLDLRGSWILIVCNVVGCYIFIYEYIVECDGYSESYDVGVVVAVDVDGVGV